MFGIIYPLPTQYIPVSSAEYGQNILINVSMVWAMTADTVMNYLVTGRVYWIVVVRTGGGEVGK